MSQTTQAILGSWSIDPAVAVALAVVCILYTRGWKILHRTRPRRYPRWRLVSFLSGIGALWIAVASPIDAFANLLLSAHMVQHLVLMSVAPPLILLGFPLLP